MTDPSDQRAGEQTRPRRCQMSRRRIDRRARPLQREQQQTKPDRPDHTVRDPAASGGRDPPSVRADASSARPLPAATASVRIQTASGNQGLGHHTQVAQTLDLVGRDSRLRAERLRYAGRPTALARGRFCRRRRYGTASTRSGPAHPRTAPARRQWRICGSSRTSFTVATMPNVTPTPSRIVRHSARSRLAKYLIQDHHQFAARAVCERPAWRSADRRSGPPGRSHRRNERNCRCSLNSAMMNQRPSRV